MGRIVGVDIGGTFTDIIAIDRDERTVSVAKVFSTPDDPAKALLQGLKTANIDPHDLELLVHGTTVATNALIERKGAKCGLIATRGFRDILELRRRDRPNVYGLHGGFEPLIPRDRRLEVAERVDATGHILVAVDDAEVAAAAKALSERGVEAIVIAFFNGYANPANEAKAKAAVASVWANEFIVSAAEIAPEFREFERTCTAAVTAYVQPLVTRYMRGLSKELEARGLKESSRFVTMQSNGGVVSTDVACRSSANLILSGPAGGVIAATRIAEAAGFRNVIACDMGGTSLDVSVIQDGVPTVKTERELEFGLSVLVPSVDIVSIGAGGGSIGWIDATGLLQVGPKSAGANPGPACYGQGGQEPTVTDANVVLGRINSRAPIGNEPGFRFDLEAARRALRERVGKVLGYDEVTAANAIVTVANAKMAGCIRMITVEKGLDPRDFALVAFGGAGALHGCALMKELAIQAVIVPYYPGLTSALGCLTANLQHDFSRTINKTLSDLSESVLEAVFREHEMRGRDLLRSEGVPLEAVRIDFEADMAYGGQTHQVRVALPSSRSSTEQVGRAFMETYRRHYGATLDGVPINVVNLRTRVVGVRPVVDLASLMRPSVDDGPAAVVEQRSVWFDGEWVQTPVYSRAMLRPGTALPGPAVIEQPDATAIVDPDCRFKVDGSGNLLIEAANA